MDEGVGELRLGDWRPAGQREVLLPEHEH
jgi:hypothetical protein